MECRRRDIPVIYIGSTFGQDIAWFKHKYSDIFSDTYFLDLIPVMNKKVPARAVAFAKNLLQSFQARKILRKHKIKACISVGGFCASATCFASVGYIPIFIHEQNSVMGSLNKLISPFARRVFSSFDFPRSCRVDYPISSHFAEHRRLRSELRSLLFLGGSQGAMYINDLALRLSPLIHSRGIRIIHQCGHKHIFSIQSSYRDLGFTVCNADDLLSGVSADVFLFDFSDRIASIMHMADFCVSRAGASSMFELIANNLPTLFIPYPYATKNHQRKNVTMLCDRGLAILRTQEELTHTSVEDIFRIFEADLGLISRGLAEFSFNGHKQIIDTVLDSI